jgi:hypothetical protein
MSAPQNEDKYQQSYAEVMKLVWERNRGDDNGE